MNRKEKHRLLAKLAGVPWQFMCPKCYGTWFGTSNALSEHCVRHCHNEHRCGCHWKGTDDECRRVADYDKDHNAWQVIRLALDGKCLWGEFVAAWAEVQGIETYGAGADLDWRMLYTFLNDLPGQVDAAIEVMK